MIDLKTISAEQTFELGQLVALHLTEGSVLCLQGDLGAGKTLFVQGFASGLNVVDEVTSPTFTIMNVYQGDKVVYHFDLYRLENSNQLYDIGFYEYAEGGNGVVIIEWPDNFIEDLPDEYVWIRINRTEKENERLVSIEIKGKRYQEFYEGLKKNCQFLL